MASPDDVLLRRPELFRPDRSPPGCSPHDSTSRCAVFRRWRARDAITSEARVLSKPFWRETRPPCAQARDHRAGSGRSRRYPTPLYLRRSRSRGLPGPWLSTSPRRLCAAGRRGSRRSGRFSTSIGTPGCIRSGGSTLIPNWVHRWLPVVTRLATDIETPTLPPVVVVLPSPVVVFADRAGPAYLARGRRQCSMASRCTFISAGLRSGVGSGPPSANRVVFQCALRDVHVGPHGLLPS